MGDGRAGGMIRQLKAVTGLQLQALIARAPRVKPKFGSFGSFFETAPLLKHKHEGRTTYEHLAALICRSAAAVWRNVLPAQRQRLAKGKLPLPGVHVR